MIFAGCAFSCLNLQSLLIFCKIRFLADVTVKVFAVSHLLIDCCYAENVMGSDIDERNSLQNVSTVLVTLLSTVPGHDA